MHLLKDENGNVIPHGHGENEHCHEQADADKTKALLTYMLQHNESHAAELDKMAAKLSEEGREAASAQVRKAVDEFMKGNMYLKLALSEL